MPWMLTALDVAEETVETANGGVIEAHHRANVLVRDLGDLTTALEGDGGPVGEMAYWAGRVARLERDAALVAEAVRRVGEWHDVLSGQVGVVEGRILEAGGVYSDHLGQLRTDLAMGHAPEEAESAMRLEAQAARAEARVRGREAAVEWRLAQAEFQVERAAELEAEARGGETRAAERAARVEATARAHAATEMEAAWQDREEARAACEAAGRWWRFPGRLLAVSEMEGDVETAEAAVALSARNRWI